MPGTGSYSHYSNSSQNKRSRTFKGRHRKENVQNILKWYNIGPNQNISGYCKTGELFAFLGPIAGRSGILKELAGINPYGGTANNVFLDDAPMTIDDSTYIDVDCADDLYSNITVLETLTYSAELRVKEKTHAAELTALRLLKEIGLKDIADQRVGEISIWQRRIILLATQVAAEYGIIFFDTPTRDLDASSCVAMIRAMQNIARSDDHQTNILVISMNSITFREYVRLDRVQLLLKYTGVNFNAPDVEQRSSYQHDTQNVGSGHSSSSIAAGAITSVNSGGYSGVKSGSAGASSIFFGPGSSALTYFVRLGRMPTPGASISDFLMDLVETLRLSELVLLEHEYMKYVMEDPLLYPSETVVGSGHRSGTSLFTGQGLVSKRVGLNISPRRKPRGHSHGRPRSRSRSGSLSAEEFDNQRSIQPFMGLDLAPAAESMSEQLEEEDGDVQLSSYGIPLSLGLGSGGGSLQGSGVFSFSAMAGVVMSVGMDRATPSIAEGLVESEDVVEESWFVKAKRRWSSYSVDLCLSDMWSLSALCFVCCYDVEEDEFAVPFVGRQFMWCLWRALAVRCRDWKNVLSIWLVSGVLVALGLFFATVGTLTLDVEGVYRRMLLLAACPYLLILVGCMWNVDDAKDKTVFVYERTQGFYNVSLFSPLCSLIADICVYRLAPPVIAASMLYPMVGLQLTGQKFGVFMGLLTYTSVAGACFSKAVLALLSAMSTVSFSKISIITGVLVSTLMLSVFTHDFPLAYSGIEAAGSHGGHASGNVCKHVKNLSLFYKGCYAMFWNEIGNLHIVRATGDGQTETVHGGTILRELGLERVSYDDAVAVLLTHILVYCFLTLLFDFALHREKYTRSYYVAPVVPAVQRSWRIAAK